MTMSRARHDECDTGTQRLRCCHCRQRDGSSLRRIATASFDVLITDLHMPDPGDGFKVVTAMRHSQPDALTLLVSGYPDIQSAMAAILLEADEIIVKPFDVGRLAELVRERMLTRRPATRFEKERVGMILQRCVTGIVEGWLIRAKQSSELSRLPLGDNERTGHLPKLVGDIALRLSKSSGTSKDSDAIFSALPPQPMASCDIGGATPRQRWCMNREYFR
jgi:CheY-like chemotaxis protein